MVGIRAAQYTSDSVTVAAQEIPLLSIDYAQGETDLNFVFFFTAPHGRRRIPVSRIRESLVQAAQAFPILLGHLTNDGGVWKVVVDPDNINWPVVTEERAKTHTLARLRRAGFCWKQWPAETHVPDLRTRESRPMLGVHIVRYACGGVGVHAKVRHQCMDGSGVWRFFGVWAAACANGRAVPPGPIAGAAPIGCRDVLASALSAPTPSAYIDGVSRFLQAAARVQHSAQSAERDGSRMARFAMTQCALDRLKLYYGRLGACSRSHLPYVREHNVSFVSTSDLVCALFWRAIARAHEALFPSDPHTCMMLACDVRARIAVPLAYCGNASFPLIIHAGKKHVLGETITDTATRIRSHVGLLSAELVQSTLEFMAAPESMRALVEMFQPGKAFFSASIINKIPMFESMNFGFGRPVHVDIPPYLGPGFSIWMPTRSAKQPLVVNLALNNSVLALVRDDPEFRRFVDILS
ncbi:hypothetical protein IWW50_006551 [Coemansia erecta]|nr:hypothetical protein GGF43_001819 [Coemansia sp. RSA 2618]KAJ2816291.1 hypothetical protein IWW50_006551 [Coemansia erecta]